MIESSGPNPTRIGGYRILGLLGEGGQRLRKRKSRAKGADFIQVHVRPVLPRNQAHGSQSPSPLAFEHLGATQLGRPLDNQ